MPFTNQPLRVLLVDDNPADRALVAREVRRDHPDAEIVEAGTPAELDAAVAADRLSLGVFDYSIGWTNGVAVLDRIRARDPDTPVILFTGSLGEEAAAEAMKIGFDDFILKAVDRLPRLRASIDMLLKQKVERQARRRAEARYQALFENVTVGLFAARRDSSIEAANEALARQLGVADLEALTGRRMLDFIRSDAAHQAWQDMIEGRTEAGITGLEVELRGSDEPRWALFDAHPADRARQQIEGVLTDVTPLRRALDQRAALLGEVHHRVHNNLQIVLALLAFQARRFIDPAVRAAFDDVAGRIHSLSLVQQRLYRAEDYSAVDFGGYLDSLIAALLHLHGRPELRVVPELAPIRLPIDQAMPLSLIANELLTNTLKHAFPDGRAGQVHVGLRRRGVMIELVIADDGVGMGGGAGTGGTAGIGSAGDGLGEKLVSRLARQLGATVETDTGSGYATTVRFAA